MAGLVRELDLVVESVVAYALEEFADFMLPLGDEGEIFFVFGEEDLDLFGGGREAVFEVGDAGGWRCMFRYHM